MKKSRLAIDDIAAMVGSIRKNVLNMRVTNIYDTHAAGSNSNKTYILKLHQPPFPKVYLLLESGVRFHTSQYARDSSPSSSALPSQFTMKLRKHLRGKRLVELRQLEGDRVIDFTFGWESLQCHLILELYASGNIILTDEKYNILSLLRTHRFDENVKMAVRQVYPIQVLENKPRSARITSGKELQSFVTQFFVAESERQQAASSTNAKAKKSQKPLNLKQLLLTKESGFGGLGPTIIEHCIVSSKLTPSTKIKSAAEFTKLFTLEQLQALVQELAGGWKLLERLLTDQVAVNKENGEPTEPADAIGHGSQERAEWHGFITLKDDKSNQYEEFTPFLYAQHADKPHKSFQTFDQAVDEYFSHFETQQAQIDRQNALTAAENRLAKLKKNQLQQLEQLHQVQQSSAQQARLIEKNQQDVENVLLVLRSAIASGMDWKGLEELVRFEQKNGNPVASLIHELDLANNRAAILLCDEDEDEDEDKELAQEEEFTAGTREEDQQAHVIWIDLSLSALANARELYAKKKKAVEKVKKATEATEKAIQQAEKKTKQTLHKQQLKKHVIYQRRKTLWFEKFYWFLSNENYLVVGGKDAHQNELLVKRYLRKGDVFVHADLHGAPTCIVRNRFNDNKTLIPVATLEQAGCMAVCRSSAWSSQVISGAYWVHADQVSKTAPTGEYLTTGSFMVRGKKNFIQPSRLEMGLGMLFRVDESCIGNHQTVSDVARTVQNDDATRADLEAVRDDAVAAVVAPSKPPPATEEVKAADEVEKEDEQEEPQDDDDDEEEEADPPLERDGKARLSAKQRRDLKKQRNKSEDAAARTKASNKPTPAGAKAAGAKAAAAAIDPDKPSKHVRGKKGKLKKIKKKYADQDEEDRRLRMEALGHAVDQQESPCTLSQDQADDRDHTDAPDATESTGAQVTEEFMRAQREKKEKFLEQEEEEVESADFFDAFTGAPVANDLLLYAMPMCAPYAALHRFNYKVKLVPGTQKKGKAAKQALEHFVVSSLQLDKKKTKKKPHPRATKDAQDGGDQIAQQQDNAAAGAAGAAAAAEEEEEEQVDVDSSATQRELMKCVPDNELINCMVGPVKLAAPGLSNSKHKNKKR